MLGFPGNPRVLRSRSWGESRVHSFLGAMAFLQHAQKSRPLASQKKGFPQNSREIAQIVGRQNVRSLAATIHLSPFECCFSSKISRFSGISKKWSASPLLSTVWGSLESLEKMDFSEKTRFPKDPLFLNPMQKYGEINGSRIVIKTGGVCATFSNTKGGQKHRDGNGRCIAILFRSIGVRDQFDSPDPGSQTSSDLLETPDFPPNFPRSSPACGVKGLVATIHSSPFTRYMGKMGSICHVPHALPASIWGHCSRVLVFASIWGTQKGDGDSDTFRAVFSQHLGILGPPSTAKQGKFSAATRLLSIHISLGNHARMLHSFTPFTQDSLHSRE